MGFDVEKGRNVLICAVMEAEIKSVLQKVPEKGIFRPVFWAMKYPGTEHECRLYTQYSQEHGCAIRASLVVLGTACEISDYLFFGTRAECLDWLREKANGEVLMDAYNHLIRRAEDQ